MRIQHPLWRGFWLAAAMAASLVLLGFTDSLAPFRADRRMIAFAGAVTLGAFLGALPGRLKRNHRHAQATTWQRCLRAFLCGAAMVLALAMLGDGRILPALMTGSAGAFAFGGMALLTGCITGRMLGRRA